MAIHRFVVAPWVEPVRIEVSRFAPSVGEDTSDAWWQDYFIEDSWQRKSPKVLQTPKGILVFQNWEQLSDTRWKIYPLTILIPQSDANAAVDKGIAGDIASSKIPKRRAIFVENPQGAEIQFKEAIDLTSGRPPPPVISGQLNGPIRIYAPPRESGEDELLIDTRDLRIDRKLISTTNRVSMKIGRSRIEGSDLSIHLDNTLLTTSENSSKKESSPFEGLDFLELIYVDRVDVELPPGGLFNNKSDATGIASTLPAKAEVLCDNAFRFDFHRSLATLSGNVRLRHLVQSKSEDMFQSDILNLHFRWNGDWSIDTIEAMGANGAAIDDPRRWVRLEAPSLAARGQGRWLKLDLNQGRVAFANHLPAMLATESSQVYLEQDSMQVWSPEIEYESEMLRQNSTTKKDESHQVSVETDPAKNGLTESSNDAESKPTRLGKLWAAGPGQALLAADDGDKWRLSWAESLQLQPEGEFDRLAIIGSANARSETQGRFSAEKVDVLLSSLSPRVIEELAANQSGRKPSAIIPRWMQATGKTIVHSPQLRAQVSDMKVWFSYPDVEAVETLLANETPVARDARLKRNKSKNTSADSRPPASAIGSAFSGLADVARNVGGNLSSSPQDSLGQVNNAIPQNSQSSVAVPGRLATNPNTVVPELPMNVTGETLIAKISKSQLGMVVDNLLLSGIVTVTRNQISEDSPLPLTITGSQLAIDTMDDGQFSATITGTPAKMSVGEAALTGPEVKFNQRSQTVWIDHPGVFRLPPEAFRDSPLTGNSIASDSNPVGRLASNVSPSPPLLSSGSSSGNEIWLEPPEVTWKGRMVFDGKVAQMDGGVQITGRVQSEPNTVWHLLGNSRELRVEMKSPVSMSVKNDSEKSFAPTSKAEVNLIRLIDQVDIKAAQTDAQGNRRSLEHLQVPELIISVPEQRILSTGPGEIRSRRVASSDSNNSSNDPFGTVRPTNGSVQARLQCVHLVFQGRMDAFITQQRVTFYDHVEALLGDILTWESGVDVHKVDNLPLGNTRMICDELSVYDESKLSYNQSTLNRNGNGSQAAWVVNGNGQVLVDSHTEKGNVSIQGQRVEYAGLNNQLRIAGSAGNPARIRQFDPRHNPAEPTVETSISEGWINLKTGESQLKISSVTGNLEQIQNGMKHQQPQQPQQPKVLNGPRENPFGRK